MKRGFNNTFVLQNKAINWQQQFNINKT